MFDVEQGPIIVAYRSRVTKTGKLLPMAEDDEYSYQIQDIVQMTAEYAKDNPATTTNLPKAVKAKLTSLLSTYGSPTDGTVRDGTVRNTISGKAGSRAA